MVIDTSAVLAILFQEDNFSIFIDEIEKDPIRLMAAPSMLETMIVIEAKKGEAGAREFDLMMHKANIDIVPFNKEHAEMARFAWQKYGKGRHAAGLNFGDCFAYALAKHSGEPLLFKGNDFIQTDIKFVLENI